MVGLNMSKITLKQIEKMNPCKDRLANFVQHNPNFKGSLIDFLMLENITHTDKVWVCVRLMTRNQKFFWARSTAYSVLDIFESRRPNDNRVRELFDYLNTIDNVENLSAEQVVEIRRLRAAADAAHATYAATSAASAADATYAATYAADAAHATYAATYAATSAASAADAAYAATYAAHATGRSTQEELNLIILQYIMEMDI